jgi:hypothetical protein
VSAAVQDPLPQQIEFRAPVHLALDQLHSVHLALDLPIAPRPRKCRLGGPAWSMNLDGAAAPPAIQHAEVVQPQLQPVLAPSLVLGLDVVELDETEFLARDLDFNLQINAPPAEVIIL